MAQRKSASRFDIRSNVTAPAKITCPVLAGIYPRERLFQALDEARQRPIIWISAPGGSGKTTLAASYLQSRNVPALWYQMDAGDNDVASFFYYMGLAGNAVAAHGRNQTSLPLLTSEYLGGLPTFTANYFRQLFGQLQRPGVVVVDNFQEASVQARVQETLAQGFEQIPLGINVIVISREPPPAVFVRAVASGRIATIGWDSLKLTESESAAIVELRTRRDGKSAEPLGDLHAQTQGWVAGLILLTEQTRSGASIDLRPQGTGTQAVFDYFASEVFHSNNAEVRTFLLKTVFLPKISPALAVSLSGNVRAEAILADLARRNLFTIRHSDGTFEYHLLFRKFLTKLTHELCTQDQIRDLKRCSAELLVEDGDVEDAIALLQEAQEWQVALELVLKHARFLHAQGRTQTLEAWLRLFPEAMRQESAWVQYWIGTCRLPYSPAEARPYFERAFALFEQQDDAAPLYMAWAKIVDSFVLEMNDLTPMQEWLDRYPTLKKDRIPPPKSIEHTCILVYLGGLTCARGYHADMPAYLERAEQFIRNEEDEFRRASLAAPVIMHYLWTGEISKAGSLIDRLSPLAHSGDTRSVANRLRWYMWKSWHAGITGDTEDASRAVSDGLALAKSAGIHLFDLQLLSHGIISHLMVGNIAEARELLDQRSRLPIHGQAKQAFHSKAISMVVLHEGDTQRAVDEILRAVQLSTSSSLVSETVLCSLGLAYAYLQRGDLDLVLKTLSQVQSHCVSARLISYRAFCEAEVYRRRGDRSLTLKALSEALSSAREADCLHSAYCARETVAALYALALEADIEADYVRSAIVKTRLQPPRGFVSDRWPWSVRVYTLGGLRVIQNDEPLMLVGKGQKKPLELLGAMIAFGGRNVSVAKLVQTLWPDNEGDAAGATFRSTLLRLRRLIGEESVIVHESHASLNPDRCWVDIWAFERLCEEVTLELSQTSIDRLLRLYEGLFLVDEDAAWAFVPREKLRSKFMRVVAQCGDELEGQDNDEKLLSLYQRALEIDPLAEEFYRRLMRCYSRLNRPAEAVALYQRCQQTLACVAKLTPANETHSLYLEIQRRVS